MLAAVRTCQYLLIAGADDVWSTGAADIGGELATRGRSHVTVRIRPGGHEFPAADRQQPGVPARSPRSQPAPVVTMAHRNGH